ncbi:acyl transferase [Hymenobacter taeanensis]|uniref:Acyl transferase n=1 Tax=Hymenobacter taeanensis TaxID=2735321 RepID=A0A6M6BJA3_9BACT|nr:MULTISPECIES: acyl transferase [Hymenobacter]QJX48130.1 acyl transferase [Hymenobacter taeanensis]UOQ82403.1 acyl transferase [Hymenobacter sp. 5414T-23]
MSFRDEYLSALPHLTAADAPAAALGLFRYQARQCAPYREYLRTLGRDPQAVTRLEDIPFLPIEFFKTHNVRTDASEWAPAETFLSSGTTQQQRSHHYVRDPLLYRQHAARIFEHYYGPLTHWTVLALLPSYLEQGQSSLVAMVDYFAQQSGQYQGAFFLHNHKALLAALREAQQDTSRQVLLIGVSYALLDLVEAYAGDPALHGLTVLETGGMKGRRREMIREELHEELRKGFGPVGIHSEYGMTELLGQAYSFGDGRFYAPPQLRILLRDPSDPFSVSTSLEAGAINIIDLANVDSCAFIETKDLARMHPDGSFEVLGRLDNSDIRGCNQMV